MSPRVKDLISSLHQKLNQEKLNLNGAKIKEEEMKMEINCMKMMIKFSLLISNVLLIGLVVCNIMK